MHAKVESRQPGRPGSPGAGSVLPGAVCLHECRIVPGPLRKRTVAAAVVSFQRSVRNTCEALGNQRHQPVGCVYQLVGRLPNLAARFDVLARDFRMRLKGTPDRNWLPVVDQLSASPMLRRLRFLGASFFTFFGAPICGYFLTQIFLEARASADWPSTDGNFTRVEIREVAGRYSSDVSYAYAVNGRNYVGTRVRASDGEIPDRRAVERELAGFAVGQRVRVYYDPADPSRSLLRVGAGLQEYVLLVVPVLMLGGGVLVLVHLWCTRPRST